MKSLIRIKSMGGLLSLFDIIGGGTSGQKVKKFVFLFGVKFLVTIESPHPFLLISGKEYTQ